MADYSEGRKLMLTSGEEECEMPVCDTDAESRGHIAEPTGDARLARLHARPQPLSMETLQGARDALERCGELGEELGSCLDLALERFCREPLYVQENARLLIRWEGGELEFIAGHGQCEISVSCSAGEPQYLITEKTWDMFVSWTHSHPEPLSIENLERVKNRLGLWRALGEELSGCFGEAISQFSREPPCVQENARLLIQWGGGELQFLSGEGECEISVSCADGRPQYNIGKFPVHMYLAQLCARPEPLSADTLWRVRDKLGSCKGNTDALRACFDRAWEGFRQEPRRVQENARLLIRWDGQELEFVSGQGQCEISVLLADGEPQYHITELGGDRPVTWSHASTEPLSVADLVRVQDRLGHWGGLGEELSGCFGEAISQFSREPPCVQGNARLLIQWDGGSLEFLSGEGECEISVRCRDGRPQYKVGELPVRMYLARLCTHPEPLSADTVRRVCNRLRNWRGKATILRTCVSHAWSRFQQEPRCVQENARLLIRCDGQELEFVSGQGQCEISVLVADGRPQYHITELGGDRPVTWSHASPEPLSVADLVRVWDRLGHWGALGEELSGCFGEAISQFSREPHCVQRNAKMRIQWDGGSLEFLSGEGQCEISVRCRDGTPQYKVGELPVRMYLARLRANPDPLSTDTLRKVRDKLGSCKWDRDDLRACFHCAWEGFRQEPPSVQGNARLLIQWGRRQLQFTSGEGQCEISVRCVDGKPQYHAVKIPVHVYLARLHSCRPSLSADTLQRVLSELRSCRGDTGSLRACFRCALDGFRREPRCVQGNARLLIQCGKRQLQFTSGNGECEISVRCEDRKPQYRVTNMPVTAHLALLRAP